MGKAMKAKAAMKGMKVMKAKRVSVIAKGKRARAFVFNGTKVKTYTGLTKDNLIEQARQDCVQGRLSSCKEGFRQQRCQGLDRGVQGGPQGFEPHWLCSNWRQVCNRQGVLRQSEGPAQVKRDSREELLPTLGFKHSVSPSWLSRGETLCIRRMRC